MLLLMLLLASGKSVLGAAVVAASPSEVQAARATASIELVKLSGDQPGAPPMGAALAAPFNEYLVRLDRLRHFDPKVEPESLLVEGQRLVFPAVQTAPGNEMRIATSIVVEQQNGEWRFVGTNSPSTGAISRCRLELGPGNSAGLDELFAIRIPSLNRYYVARKRGDGLHVREIHPNGSLSDERTWGSTVVELAIEAIKLNESAPN